MSPDKKRNSKNSKTRQKNSKDNPAQPVEKLPKEKPPKDNPAQSVEKLPKEKPPKDNPTEPVEKLPKEKPTKDNPTQPVEKLSKTKKMPSHSKTGMTKTDGNTTRRLHKNSLPTQQSPSNDNKTKHTKKNTTQETHEQCSPEEKIDKTLDTIQSEQIATTQLPQITTSTNHISPEDEMAQSLKSNISYAIPRQLQSSTSTSYDVVVEFMNERTQRHSLGQDWTKRKILTTSEVLLLVENTISFLQECKTILPHQTQSLTCLSLEDFISATQKKIPIPILWTRPIQQPYRQGCVAWLLPSVIKDNPETSLAFLVGACLAMTIDPSFPNYSDGEWIWRVIPARILLCNTEIPLGLIRLCQIATHPLAHSRFQTLDDMIWRLQNVITYYQKSFVRQKQTDNTNSIERILPTDSHEIYSWSTAGYVVGKYPRVAIPKFETWESFRNQCQDRIFWHHTNNHKFSLLLVADGVTNTFLGSGDRAADILIAIIQEKIRNTNFDGFAIQDAIEFITNVCYTATDNIIAEVIEKYRPAPTESPLVMGTTAAIVAIVQNHAVICSIGDSRVYLIRPGEFAEQCTVDCTPHVLAHRYPEYQGLYYDNQTLAFCVGHAQPTLNSIEPCHDPCFFRIIPLQPNDHLLVCSDGLFDALDPVKLPEDVFEMIWDKQSIANRVNISTAYQAFQLLTLAMRTGEDDASIIVSRCLPNKESRTVRLAKN